MPRLSLFVALFALAGWIPLIGDEGRTVLAKGLFAYEAPAGWTVSQNRFSEYPIALGPRVNDFSPVLTVELDDFSGSLHDYVAACGKTMETGGGIYDHVNRIKSEPFATAAGIQGTREFYSARLQGKVCWLICYYLDIGPTKKTLVTGTCLEKGGSANVALFDAAMKGFTLE